MPAAIAIGIRREIVERREKGESMASIARELSMPYVTVRGIYQHYQDNGKLEPNYERCGQPGIRKDQAVYEAAVEMKRQHPRWGAGLIWVELSEHFDEAALPSIRTLQRWFKRAGVAAPPRDETPRPSVKRGTNPHEVWALDAKEEIRLADGSHVSWFIISDEASGAVLSAELFPPQTLAKDRPGNGQAKPAANPGTMGATGADTHG